MEFRQLTQKALEIKKKYDELNKAKTGKKWTRSQLMEGFVGDVGDLMKLVMAKEGAREIENADGKLKHELADCLWCVIVLADQYGISLEDEFMKTMNELEKRINTETVHKKKL